METATEHPSLACRIYRWVARASAWWLARAGGVGAIYAHRSLATGEVVFGRSDQDLVVILPHREPQGQELARLYQRLRGLRRLNPTLCHLEVLRVEELPRFAQLDTAWAFQERHARLALEGELPAIPPEPVRPDDALRRFLLWCEVFVPGALRRGSSRDLRKIALECWNFFAVAQSLLDGPLTRREEMAEHLQQTRGESAGLERPERMLSFVLGLAAELQADRRPALAPLSAPYIGAMPPAPHGLPRNLVVLPRASWPLPSRLPGGAVIVTPELLDLFVGLKNGWLWWDLPLELKRLGLTPPAPAQLRHQSLYFASPHFLRFPGFADQQAPHPGFRLTCLERALPWLGQEPPESKPEWPPSPARLSAPDQVLAYYRQEYDQLLARCRQLDLRLRAPSGPGGEVAKPARP